MASKSGLLFGKRVQYASFFKNTRTWWSGTRRNATTATPAESFMSRMWNSPVGIKTVHFWAPVMKWSLVLAGIGDFNRPAEKLSLTQNLALSATGAIWTRWCLIIKPRNILLAAVNFFLGCVGIIQVSRILLWRQSNKNESLTTAIKSESQELVQSVKS